MLEFAKLKIFAAGFGTALVLTSGLAAAQSTLLGSQGQFSVLLSRLEWEPGYGCRKPTRPYQMTEWAVEQYIADGERYLNCIQRQADSDMVYARAVVREGYQDAADDFLDEVRRGY